ncbi:hypothetical protein Cgig2_009044 [Carnegiea gigantea]|uniref:Argonaute 4 n=1 Tax=Carnegiea gigantea TaxID=171969 RepID=A0A9Q1JLQ4_9CARY|nr:hypothetical protein Cgig2_009044 [Carnegiea gigantea]
MLVLFCADFEFIWPILRNDLKSERVLRVPGRNQPFASFVEISVVVGYFVQAKLTCFLGLQDMDSHDGNGLTDALAPPPPPPEIPPNVVPLKAEPEPPKKKRVPIPRRGLGTRGQKIQLLSNHFKVNISNVDGHFFHYSVCFCLLLSAIMNNGNASPDGHGSPNESDRKRLRRPYQSKTFKVELSFAAKIPMKAIANVMRGEENENSQEAIRVLDIILRQHAAKQGCLLVRQSFFHNDPKNFVDVGGGVLGCRGFHSSFRGTQSGLSLNIDVSTTMIIQPGPVVDFLISNQNVRDPYSLDWAKAKRVLKNLRIKTTTSNQEYKITGLSEKPCREQTFSLKQRGRGDDGEPETVEVTVYDYFVNHRNIELRYSADLPCINVGKPKRPTYFPLEVLCSLVSLQRYTKALSTLQRSSLVEKSRQKPQERMSVLSHALKVSNYDAEPMLRSCGISISNSFTQIDARVLPAPKLKVGNGDDFFPRNGRWNFNNKKLVEPTKIERWAVVNFSARCDARNLVRDLMKCAEAKGIGIEPPFDIFDENPQNRRAPPLVRVEKMFEDVQSKLPGPPKFLLCLLPERKNCDLYGPWKKKNLADFGIVTQCMAPTRVNDQYLTNCLLKINAKLGGLNSLLAIEQNPSTPLVSKVPSIILGIDVSHGSPGHSDVPSIAAGTTRPTHYHVLLDEVGFSPDDLQELVHSLSYVYQRSTTAISVVAPVCYAHLAATQVGQWLKFEDASETSSSHDGVTSAGSIPVPQLPRLQDNVSSSMFFC